MRNRKEGFTLIELLIVIAIIGILAAVLIPNLLDARRRAFDTGAQSCLKELATAEEVNMVDNNGYDADAAVAANISSCDDVAVTNDGGTSSAYNYTGSHNNSAATFRVTPGDGVQAEAP